MFRTLTALCVLVLTACGGPDSPLMGGAPTPPPSTPPPTSPLPTSTDGAVAGLTWVELPGGTFQMGVAGGADNPTRPVTLSPFALGETEVTNLQYIAFLDAALAAGAVEVARVTQSSPAGTTDDLYVFGSGDGRHPGKAYVQLSAVGGATHAGDPEHALNRSVITYDPAVGFDLVDAAYADWPVNWIKWHGADAFAAFYGHRLPTEAEWEYAASAGGTLSFATADGDLSAATANYNGDQPAVYNPDGHVVAVKSYAPNPWGLYEMSGNVWEWCADWYDPDFYRSGAAADPLNAVGDDSAVAQGSAKDDPVAGRYRVRRGGSWNYHAATLANTARAFDFPTRGNNHFGFRIAASR